MAVAVVAVAGFFAVAVAVRRMAVAVRRVAVAVVAVVAVALGPTVDALLAGPTQDLDLKHQCSVRRNLRAEIDERACVCK